MITLRTINSFYGTWKSLSKAGKALFQIFNPKRTYAEGERKGLVLGAFDGCYPGDFVLTGVGAKFDEEVEGKLAQLLKGSNVKKGKAQLFTNLGSSFGAVAVAGLGPETASYNDLEVLDEAKENIRVAAGVGAQALQNKGYSWVNVEGMGDPESAAEGSALGVWKYEDMKKGGDQFEKPELYQDSKREAWQRGMLKADCQNLARKLEEAPGNLMTPTILAQQAIDALCPCGVQVEVRDQNWIEAKKMQGFLTVAKGSCEPPIMIEINYCGGSMEDKPIVMIGKGVTFDSGGTYLKKCNEMLNSRGNKAGAAVTMATILAASMMNLPINLSGLIPACENLPSGMAMKPGDVVIGLGGKTIMIEATDHEGRILLSDIVSYSSAYKPFLIMTLATMSKAARKALGASATPLFTTSESLWKELEQAGASTGDRVWRLPLWNHYTQKITDYQSVDINNVGKETGGGTCLGASFLAEFVPKDVDFIHLDMTGTGMESFGIGHPYLKKGLMTGRPTRTLVQFLYQLACPHEVTN